MVRFGLPRPLQLMVATKHNNIISATKLPSSIHPNKKHTKLRLFTANNKLKFSSYIIALPI